MLKANPRATERERECGEEARKGGHKVFFFMRQIFSVLLCRKMAKWNNNVN